jgi:hypothetical protein
VRNDCAEIAQAARQCSLDKRDLRFEAPDRDRPVQLLDLFDDLSHDMRTRLFLAFRQDSQVNFIIRKNLTVCEPPILRRPR